MESLESLKRDAKVWEMTVEQQLSAFMRTTSAATAGGARRVDEELGLSDDDARAREIQEGIDKLVHVVDAMARLVAAKPSRVDTAMVQRLREVIHEFKTSLKKQVQSVRQRREQAALFADMRGGRGEEGDAAATDSLLRERSSLTASHRAIDDIIAQAAHTRETLRTQRTSITNSLSGLATIAATMPGVSNLIDAIRSRRTYNNRVVAVVIAVCICFLLWYLLRSR